MKMSDEGKRSPKFVIIDSQASVSGNVQLGVTDTKYLEKVDVDSVQLESRSDKAEKVKPSATGTRPAQEYWSQSKKELAKRRIIHPGMKNSEVMNAFRSLRMSLLSKMEKANSIVLVSAINHGGGASFSAINLATAFTFEHNRRALLVDCNLARPSLAKNLGVEADRGLYEYLVEAENDIDKLIYPTTVPRLSVVPCGGAYSRDEGVVEFFTGSRMQAFIEEVRSRDTGRTIVLDAPPVLESADTKVLAGMSDLVVVALPYKGATPSRVNKTLEEFGSGKVSGFIMVN